MARYTTTIASPWNAEDAFDYMADLRNFADWDPGVKASTITSGSEPAVGTAYKVTVALTNLTYVTKEFDHPHRTVAEAKTALFRSYDIIEVTETDDGCEVFYDAKLTLNGPFGLADPLLGLAFGRIGDKAAAGMAAALGGKKIR
ncbi:MAG: ribosome-associated toxin RatA of RatAB toxin-antitoxin module [Paracrocinitomix sp.]|jgi:ribosome-associated toxin RatA of RatAB toxin-antitoxin module